MDYLIWGAAILVAVSVVTVLANLFITGAKYEKLDSRHPRFRKKRQM